MILNGLYKDEISALKDITIFYVQSKVKQYSNQIQEFQKKYNLTFDEFTKSIKNNASMAMEDDWLDWKISVEMKNAWTLTLNEIL